jgi:hypothetical protein
VIAVLTLYAESPARLNADHDRLVQMVAPRLACALNAAIQTLHFGFDFRLAASNVVM